MADKRSWLRDGADEEYSAFKIHDARLTHHSRLTTTKATIKYPLCYVKIGYVSLILVIP